MTSIVDPKVVEAVDAARLAARTGAAKTVVVGGEARRVPHPFPSPADWRDCWVYFLMTDRFANPTQPPRGPWNRRYGFRHGGTFTGVTAQLDYLHDLGVRALWLSPVVKNPKPDWEFNYHGYAAQDFLSIDERFASDGTAETAERELNELVEQAHARGIYVILDVVLNHAGRVFDYVRDGRTVTKFADPAVLGGPLGSEPPIRWVNGLGFPRADWQDDVPPGTVTSPDDAVYPEELRRRVFFRRRGTKVSDAALPGDFARGDFDDLRQLVFEYDATSDPGVRAELGRSPVLNLLVQVHAYLIARFDIDALRIDTAKYVSPTHLEWFGNAVREFAQSIGKRNFFMFGEVYDDEDTIARFVGRNSTETASFGIDAALDFPLFFQLPGVAKGELPVEGLRLVFERRKAVERELLSTHGEAGRYFVTFLDNHDQRQRFNHPLTPERQVTLGLACLFCLQGIPTLYYGTEQGLQGTVDLDGNPDLAGFESTREALWGKPGGFDRDAPLYGHVRELAAMRAIEPALRYGRLYFREVSGNGRDFGHSSGRGGVVAFSRVLFDREVLVVANCHPTERFDGFVVQDLDLNRRPRRLTVAYSNLGTTGAGEVRRVAGAAFHHEGRVDAADTAAAFVGLAPSEVQVLVPE